MTSLQQKADKAPLEVVSVLKGLVEDGQLALSDGRMIVRPDQYPDGTTTTSEGHELIKIHPDFKVLALANPAGYPFLGNDFFSECGDVFSCHVVENPDPTSQELLLQSYGPDVSVKTVQALVRVFDRLRALNESGVLYVTCFSSSSSSSFQSVSAAGEDGFRRGAGRSTLSVSSQGCNLPCIRCALTTASIPFYDVIMRHTLKILPFQHKGASEHCQAFAEVSK